MGLKWAWDCTSWRPQTVGRSEGTHHRSTDRRHPETGGRSQGAHRSNNRRFHDIIMKASVFLPLKLTLSSAIVRLQFVGSEGEGEGRGEQQERAKGNKREREREMKREKERGMERERERERDRSIDRERELCCGCAVASCSAIAVFARPVLEHRTKQYVCITCTDYLHELFFPCCYV
jgi:hypothetical protein